MTGPSFHLVTRIHVLTAIKVHDQSGGATFLEDLGFDGPGDDVLVERGKRYPATALLAYAHGRATGRTLTPHEVPFGATSVLGDLGFKVASRDELDRPATRKATRVPGTRAPRATTPKAPPKPEPVVKVCPTCFTALPVSGRCDYCD